MPSIDFAIVTGLTEEFDILNELFREFGIPEFREISENAEIWYRTRIAAENNDRMYEVVASFQDDMGVTQALSLTRSLIARWNPAYVLLVGIAGSFSKDVTFGDVLVSQQVFYYDPGKAVEEGIEYRPEGYPCSIVLIRQLNALVQDKIVMGRIQSAANARATERAARVKVPTDKKKAKGFNLKAARGELRAHFPKIRFGTLASGSLVVASKTKQRELLGLHGKILGTEMEGAGMMIGTFREEMPPAAVVVKGVSDAADEDKAKADAKEYWRELAKENSARVAVELIRRGKIRSLNADDFELDPRLESVAEATRILRSKSHGASPLAFPGLVVPRGPLTELRVAFAVRGKSGPLDVLEAVIRYVDLNGEVRPISLAPGQNTWGIDIPFTTAPVGLFILADGEPTAVQFEVGNSYKRLKEEWVPRKG